MSKLWAPTLSLSRVRKELPALMAILTVLSLWQAALYHNRNRIQVRCAYTCRAVNIVLISTYELGRQPCGLASPAAWLRKRGHHVVSLDLARQSLDESVVRDAGLIAIYLPMHTATRLAAQLIPSLRDLNSSAHLCCYGLYAPMNVEYLRTLGVSTILGGEFEDGLVHLAERLAAGGEQKLEQQHESLISLARLSFEVPDRSVLPAIEKYAHLIVPGDGYRIVGSTEASRGCKHLCRHCPIVPVYKGVFRIVSRDIVLEDIRCQAAAGAQHISFGDPDFFNGIRHAMELVLEFLDKGHTREDFLRVIKTFRELGMTLHPTFVPFTPWTTLDGYLDLLDMLQHQALTENVAPIQLGIRLLIPEGSRMLELEDVRGMVGPFDPQSLAYPWENADPRADALSEAVQEIAAAAERQKESRPATFERIWKAAHAAAGLPAPAIAAAKHSKHVVPYLSEPWYCCAEPTRDQLVSIGTVKPPLKNVLATADGFV